MDVAEGNLPAGYYENPGIAIAPIPRSIEIGNYELGADFTFNSYFHNGDGLRAKLIKVTTEPGESVAAIPIKATLANNGLLDIIALQSNLTSETLEAVSYDGNTNLFTIKGFLPDASRILKVIYKTTSTFSVEYSLPPKTQTGFSLAPPVFEKFVTFEKTTFFLKPLESIKFNVRVTIPPNWQPEQKYIEFEILVSEVATSSSGAVGVTRAIAQPVLINLK